MASVPGRPYNVGFTFRIIAARPESNSDYWQYITDVTEYRYNKATLDLEDTVQHVTAPLKLGRGDYVEFTAGRNEDKFTVVHVKCSNSCEVSNIRPA